MAYITQTWSGTPAGDLTNRLGNALLAKLFPNGSGGLDSTAGGAAVTDAECEIDTLLGPDFTVPFTGSIAAMIVRCACDMAAFYGYENKPEFRARGGENPEQKRYDRARTTLKEIKSGARSLGRTTPSPTKSAAVGGVVYHSTETFVVDVDENGDGPTGGL